MSRNQREGRYACKRNGKHIRTFWVFYSLKAEAKKERQFRERLRQNLVKFKYCS